MLDSYEKFIKRAFDLSIALSGIIVFAPLFLVIAGVLKLSSNDPIFFIQTRIGQYAKKFQLIKFRTMVNNTENEDTGTITVARDNRITTIGKILRKWKLDEFPALWNVLKGDMSLVGPRPDVSGYSDRLRGKERKILEIRPGITGPATLKYSNEETLLAKVDDPQKYNDEVIFPDKVHINLDYLENWSLWGDIKIIWKTIFRNNY